MSTGKSPERNCSRAFCACDGSCYKNAIDVGEVNINQIPMMPISHGIGQTLRLCRKLKGLTLRDVEAETGIDNGHLCQIESGKIKEPSFSDVVVLAKFYKVKLDDLISI